MGVIDIGGVRINPALVETAQIETRHYMNGSASWLVVKMAGGNIIRKEHGWGFNAFDALGKIDAALSMQEAFKAPTPHTGAGRC